MWPLSQLLRWALPSQAWGPGLSAGSPPPSPPGVVGVLESRAPGGHSSWVMETQNLQSISREKEQIDLF